MKKIGQLASTIAKIEGHKSQTRIGDIREILAILSDLSYQSPDAMNTIVKNGIARAKRKKKKSEKQSSV